MFSVGSNDLTRHTQPQHVVDDIMDLYSIGKRNYCKHVFVGQIPPRLSPRGMSRDHYEDLRREINYNLKQLLRNDYFQISNITPRCFLRDGVHLNRQGEDIYVNRIQNILNYI